MPEIGDPLYVSQPVKYRLLDKPQRNIMLSAMRGWSPLKRGIIVNERIVEGPFVFQNLQLEKGSKILDIGCCESIRSIELASLGHTVIGIDLNDYGFTHPNFSFVKGDFLTIDLVEEDFDAVVAVSTIEHFGLHAYGYAGLDLDADVKAMDKILMVLKPGGYLIMTVPFGRNGRTSWYRVYNGYTLRKLLRNFQIRKIEFFSAAKQWYWVACSEEEASSADSISGNFVRAVACVVADKPYPG